MVSQFSYWKKKKGELCFSMSMNNGGLLLSRLFQHWGMLRQQRNKNNHTHWLIIFSHLQNYSQRRTSLVAVGNTAVYAEKHWFINQRLSTRTKPLYTHSKQKLPRPDETSEKFTDKMVSCRTPPACQRTYFRKVTLMLS